MDALAWFGGFGIVIITAGLLWLLFTDRRSS